uniref:Ig-like domain-containing protein n=1 Tax=Calidris pygmaea TaxID=425635 RepID=A0A8C3KSK1_9CHAR
MACLPTAPPALALRRWLGLGLFVGLCLHLGCALEKKEVKSKLGETVGLPCCHEIPSSDSLHNYRVYWQKNIREVVLAYAEGKEISKNQRYENRTEMNDRNFTLWISPVEIPDKGPYQCVVQHLKSSQNPSVLCDETVTLIVSGFPKPKMSGTLNNESVVWNVTWVSESSLSPYNVTGKLQLNVTKDVIFTCSVESDGLTKSASLLLKKTNDCIVPTIPPSYNVITASSIIIIIFLLAITLAARYLPRHVCSRCHKPQDSVEEGVKECTKTPLSSKVTSETSSV